jgi:hypothetical protein
MKEAAYFDLPRRARNLSAGRRSCAFALRAATERAFDFNFSMPIPISIPISIWSKKELK